MRKVGYWLLLIIIGTLFQNCSQGWMDQIEGSNPTNASSSGASSVVNDIEAPAVMLTSPSDGASLTATVNLSAVATDNKAVAGVQFYVDGQMSGSEVKAAPYTLALNTVSLSNGSHVIMAKARDAAGNATLSASATVTTFNSMTDTVKPTASISAPTAGATITGNVSVTATASDNVGVAGVQFLLDGQALGAEATSSPYSVSWNSTTASNGAHSLTARVRDTAGNTATSAAVSVSVSNVIANPNATYQWLATNVLASKCTVCHNASLASGNVILNTYAGVKATVTAGNAMNSLIYTVSKPGGGMPVGGTPMTTTELQNLSDWINNGALNN